MRESIEINKSIYKKDTIAVRARYALVPGGI
jgi:hypothetical protein